MYARSAGFRDDSLALLAPCLKTHQLQLRRLVLADNEFSAQGLVSESVWRNVSFKVLQA